MERDAEFRGSAWDERTDPDKARAKRDWTQEQIDDHLFQDDESEFNDDDYDWVEAMCSMGPDGQCGQAGSEHCEFECPNMRAWRAEQKRK